MPDGGASVEQPPRRRQVGRRLDVLRTLQDADGPLGIADLAGRLGVHPNTVRFHLETLLEEGRVERVAAGRRTVGRPPVLFRACPAIDRSGPRNFRLLAEILLEELATRSDPAGRAAEAGRAWGRRQALTIAAGSSGTGEDGVLALLLDLLGDLGFAPERHHVPEDAAIGLRHCPFLEAVESGAEAVCALHLGLMQGAMAVWSPSRTVARLEPFVRPDLCVAHLTDAGQG